MSSKPTLLSWLMVVTLGVTWGSTFLVTELALEGISPFWLAAGRQVIGAAVMVPVWILTRRPNTGPQDTRARWPYLLIAGVTSSALPFALLAWGQQYVTSGFAGVPMAAVALIVLPLAHVFIPGEKAGPRRIAGFAIGFVGVCILIGARAFDSSGAALEPAGRLACLGAAACYAVSSILLRRCPPIDPIAMATALIVVGAGVAVVFALLAEGAPPLGTMAPPQDALIALLVLGLIPTAAANFLRVFVIRTAGPVFMSITNYIVPVWSVLMGAWILNEPVPGSMGLAVLLILCGVALSQSRAFLDMLRR
ncbi:MAG: DMT family transporter [Pseudomonadota bacterium]